MYLVVALVFPALSGFLPRSGTAVSAVRVRYPDGQGILRQALQTATARGFAVNELSVSALPGPGGFPWPRTRGRRSR
ncbi:MAG TPA: hypothetical protein VIF35_15280 [Streptosporangiaceae bacterium]|jgi:hypothetical protein